MRIHGTRRFVGGESYNEKIIDNTGKLSIRNMNPAVTAGRIDFCTGNWNAGVF